MRFILNIAHRGASADHPENTLAAFEAAIEAGADMCELDVQRTRDGFAVVIHDETLDRTTTGAGEVSDFTLEQIRSLYAPAKFRDRLVSERVPTLEEVFALTHGRCGLNIEIKCANVEDQICSLIRKYDAHQTALVSSFEWDTLGNVRRIDPAVRIGLLAEHQPDGLLKTASEMNAYAINPRHDLATLSLCSDAHRAGLKVLVWTVDDPNTMRNLIATGVDGIMTNQPARLTSLMGHHGPNRG
jgi:glycerophosphoryl diester phosphodiesterase